MPRRTDISSVLIIGAGPIVIGQACEFDYSGAQACKALKEEGYRVILVNSNPATIMTDPGTADATYIEPITWQMVERIIDKERPDALLPTMGGQTALNCALDLARNGVLAKYGVELIGAREEAIEKAEDRLKFKEAMTKIGLDSAPSGIAHSMEEAWTVQRKIAELTTGIGFPMIIRPSFTLGGTGGGIAYNAEEFEVICKGGLEASPTSELLIEESLIGWKEFEMEVVPIVLTTASSSAPLRTSTPWASTPVIPSPWHRPRRSPTRNIRSCAMRRSPSFGRSASTQGAPTSSFRSIPRMAA